MTQSAVNSSYLMGQGADIQGWRNRSYFTYFSEFCRNNTYRGTVEAAVMAVLFLVAVTGNVSILVELIRKGQSKRLTNCFIGNLALSDILFTLTCPLIAIIRVTETWVLGRFICSMIMYVLCVCGVVSIWTMTIISTDRYIRIVKQYVQPMGLHTMVIIICALWLTAFLGCLPMAVYFDLRQFILKGNEVQICTLVWPNTDGARVSEIFVTSFCLLGFIAPLILMSCNYFRVFKKLWKSRKAVGPDTRNGLWMQRIHLGTHQHFHQRMRRRDERDFRVVRMLLLLVTLFLLMFAPIFVCFAGIQYDGVMHIRMMRSQYLVAALCVAYANSCINPVIYGLIDRKLVSNCRKCATWASSQRLSVKEETIHIIA